MLGVLNSGGDSLVRRRKHQSILLEFIYQGRDLILYLSKFMRAILGIYLEALVSDSEGNIMTEHLSSLDTHTSVLSCESVLEASTCSPVLVSLRST